ncbi:hypothetical protein [Nocardia blacklockiae]|uniref:hypothetical protein n=1 Tax=Nocardia blacklockiae TaxID=480036 RepID=UPI001894840E|nr:hypothetical protein [Nocardia blacklockiae]MBF6175536.1 hypothetical protein [Nocardia blacklockiae]
MSELETIDNAVGTLRMSTFGQTLAIPAAIGRLLGVAPPKGDGDATELIAEALGKASGPTDQIAVDLGNVASHDLPEVWVGRTSDLAGDVVVAVTEDIAGAAIVLRKARNILLTLATDLTDARKTYDEAQDPLRRAAAACEDGDYLEARSLGISGGESLAKAYRTAADAGRDAARDLTALTDQARAHALKSENLDSSDRVVLAESATPGGAHEENQILSEAEAERAGQRLDQLSEDDRRRMDDLLSQAKSPQERAYLMKTLAAGHSVNEVAKFGGLIHGHGDDPSWLQNHLTPITHSAQATNAEYDGASWTQGRYPTCVASSTVMARAMVDPSYTLMLTTGNKPDDPKSTSREAFLDRLRDEQATLYDHGRDEGNWLDQIRQTVGKDGMYDDEGRIIANEQIGAYTGQSYDERDMNDTGDRRAILPDIEKAVSRGQPVPFQVSGDDGGHQMLIIGHKGDQLEVYNPWGVTSWISEDDFVNGHVDQMPGTDGKPQKVPPSVAGVLLPH